jgi:hypothetical protein
MLSKPIRPVHCRRWLQSSHRAFFCPFLPVHDESVNTHPRPSSSLISTRAGRTKRAWHHYRRQQVMVSQLLAAFCCVEKTRVTQVMVRCIQQSLHGDSTSVTEILLHQASILHLQVGLESINGLLQRYRQISKVPRQMDRVIPSVLEEQHTNVARMMVLSRVSGPALDLFPTARHSARSLWLCGKS